MANTTPLLKNLPHPKVYAHQQNMRASSMYFTWLEISSSSGWKHGQTWLKHLWFSM